MNLTCKYAIGFVFPALFFIETGNARPSSKAAGPHSPSDNPPLVIKLDHEEKYPQPAWPQDPLVVWGKDSKGYPVPRILVTRKSIEFRSESGRVIRKIPYTSHDPATNFTTLIRAAHLGMYAYAKNIFVDHFTYGGEGDYSVYDENGRRTLHIKAGDGEAVSLVPSPSGDYAVIPMGPPAFYDARGMRNEKWVRRYYDWARSGFKGGAPVQEWPGGQETGAIGFSPDGSRVVVSTKKYNETIAFDAQGNKLWQKEGCKPLAISPHGQVVCMDQSRILALSSSGAELWTSTINAHPEIFSADGNLMLATYGPSIYLINMNTGRVIWQWQGEWHELKSIDTQTHQLIGTEPDLGIYGATAVPDFERIVAIGNRIGNAATLKTASESIFVFNGQGRLLTQKTIKGHPFAFGSSIAISDDGNWVAIQGNSGLLYFKIRKKEEK